MRRSGRSLITLVALGAVLWLIWQRLHIVLWVSVPWWAFLIMAILLFLAIDHLLAGVLRRGP